MTCACCQADFRIEEAVAVSPGRLGAVKRKVRHLHQTVSARRVLGRERNANARGDVDFITIDIKRLRDDIDNTVSKSTGCSALVIVTVLNNCKLVTAQARQHVGFPQRRLQTNGGFAQQCIANGMAKRIVDMFEAVEVQQQDRE